MPPTRRQLEEWIAGNEALIAEINEKAKGLEALNVTLRAALEAMGTSQVLRIGDTNSTVRTMDVNTQGQSESVKRGAGRATRKHPAQRKLYERGTTITDVAKELGEGRPRVSAWFAPVGKGNRPIPRRHADTLHKKYGIPFSAWSRVAE